MHRAVLVVLAALGQGPADAAPPADAAALFSQAEAYRRKHRDEDAEAALKKGLSLAPDSAVGLESLAALYVDAHHWTDARAAAEKALKAAPESARLHLLLWKIADSAGDDDTAKKEGERGTALAGAEPSDPDVLAALSEFENNHLRYEEAVRWGEKAIAARPDDAEIRSLQAANYFNLHKNAEAVAAVGAAVKLDPDSLWYSYQAGVIHEVAGDNDAAEADYKKAKALEETYFAQAPREGWRRMMAAGLETHFGNKDRAFELYKKAVEIDPGDFDLQRILAEHYWGEKRDYAGAEPHYAEAARLKPSSTDSSLWARLAICRAQLGKWDQVEAPAKRAIELKTQEPLAYNALGVAYSRKKRYSEALEPDREAVRLIPDDPNVRFQLGYDLAYSGDHDGALAAYRELRPLDAKQADQLLDKINHGPHVYRSFQVRVNRSERQIPPGHEKYGYYIYNRVTRLDDGRECTLSCWFQLQSPAPDCFQMTPGATVDLRQYDSLYYSKRRGEYTGTFTEFDMSGQWKTIEGCAD